MADLTSKQEEEVRARIATFNTSGFKVKVCGDVTRYCGSFVGRDFKAWAQMAPFIITPYITEEETTVWLNLSKVHVHVACNQLHDVHEAYNLTPSSCTCMYMYIRCSSSAIALSTLLTKEQNGKPYAANVLHQYTMCIQTTNTSRRYTRCST